MGNTYEQKPASEDAVIAEPRDNLAVVKKETEPGLELTLAHDRVVRVSGSVRPGPRFATREIPAGEFVLQYGQPIGTSLGIESGAALTPDKKSHDVAGIRDLPR